MIDQFVFKYVLPVQEIAKFVVIYLSVSIDIAVRYERVEKLVRKFKVLQYCTEFVFAYFSRTILKLNKQYC